MNSSTQIEQIAEKAFTLSRYSNYMNWITLSKGRKEFYVNVAKNAITEHAKLNPVEVGREVWQLLEPGVDTWREGDESYAKNGMRWVSSALDGNLVSCDHSLGRRRISIPGNDAEQISKVRTALAFARRLALAHRQTLDVTMIEAVLDLPMLTPPPVEPERDENREQFEAWWSKEFRGFVQYDDAWTIWLASRESLTNKP